MTVAICINCGTRKRGAFTPCLHCGFEPETPEDQSKGILLSDHNLSAEEMQNVSQQLQEGNQITFDETELREMSEEIGNMDMKKAERETKWFISGCFLLATMVVVSLIALALFLFER